MSITIPLEKMNLMKIKILSSASQDLIDGYWFYEKQSEGVGAYFLDTLYSDIWPSLQRGQNARILNTEPSPFHSPGCHNPKRSRAPSSLLPD